MNQAPGWAPGTHSDCRGWWRASLRNVRAVMVWMDTAVVASGGGGDLGLNPGAVPSGLYDLKKVSLRLGF